MDKHQTSGRSKLEEAIRRYEHAAYDTLPVFEGEICHSPRYCRRMRRLMKTPTGLLLFGDIGKRAAAILVAVCFLFGGVLSVSASRRTVSDWITSVCERFTELFFSESSLTVSFGTVDAVMCPEEVPEGFTLCERYDTRSEFKMIWKNAEGEMLIFVQAPRTSKSTVDHEMAVFEIFYEGELRFAVSQKSGMQCYYWSDTDYAYTLIAPDALTREMCVRTALSVRAQEP